MVSGINEDDSAESLLALYDAYDKKTEQNDIVAVIDFEAVGPARNENYFLQFIFGFVNQLELNDQKY